MGSWSSWLRRWTHSSRGNAPVGFHSRSSSPAGCFSSAWGSCLKPRSKDDAMSFLVHWIPALAGGFVLLIASWVLERRIRAERRAQAARGEPVVTPAPGTVHQRAVLELARRLQEYLKTHVIGEALPAPFEVEFTEDSAVQPDILVILDPQRDRLTAARLYGPPALIVEVVSYSSKRTDRLHKRRLYSEEGVPEYWIVDRGPPHRALATRRHERRDRYPSPGPAACRVAPRTDH